jgi:alkanesulfonate monooxygenase SsuD/methylene tetrahydromethanopterin reductase-like flavin-dependent oxidoreductase (luciferase family)
VPDYGHDLQFSTFPEPGQSAVELGVLSEQWGYDLIAFRDHSHKPEYFDVWVLMSWIAARTERIRLAPVVLNMAMRSPTIVAKSAASLDRLSDGRFELGLGAGILWDEMVAMGVTRRTAAQSITALSEAIDIIRASWKVGYQDQVRVEGKYHHVDGMEPGPAPAHDMPIWLGAYKPRMLELVGRKADGWAAILGGIQTHAQWKSANEIIDDSALDAGRVPADIRRIAGISGNFEGRAGAYLQGPASQWVEQLLPSVVEDGVSAFIVATDDRLILQHFAEQVIPSLRDAVAAERTSAEDYLG